MTNKESTQELRKYLKELREQKAKTETTAARLFKKLGRVISEERRERMENEIESEAQEAAEAIRAKYEKEAPAAWNEGKTNKAYKRLLNELKS
jgi:hypothetical protein